MATLPCTLLPTAIDVCPKLATPDPGRAASNPNEVPFSPHWKVTIWAVMWLLTFGQFGAPLLGRP